MVSLLFLQVRRRREMKLLMMKMIMLQWEPVCHKTKWIYIALHFRRSNQVNIYSSPCISDGQPCGGGRIWTVNTIHLVGSAGSHTSQPDLTTGHSASDKTRYFSFNYFVTGENDKDVLSVPGTQGHRANICKEVSSCKEQHSQSLWKHYWKTAFIHVGR
jgi:hypothetical protein